MKAMQINGLGLVGSFGCGKQELLNSISSKRGQVSQIELRDKQFSVYQADTSPLEKYLNKRALRRIDHFSRLALLGAFQALEDADQPEIDRSRLGVVICSGFGALATTFKFLDSVLEDGDAFASPTAFSNSVHNAAAAHISMQLKITGPSLTVSQFDQSLISGMVSAQQWLDEGRVDAILLGVVDEYHSVLGYCWERFVGRCEQAEMLPFDFSRQSAVVGEGAAFVLLQPQKAGQTGYASIDQLEMGVLSGSQPLVPSAEPVILGCEGLAATAAYYRSQLNGGERVACYSPLYGASPVTPGFDLAVAALALQRGEMFPSAAQATADLPAVIAAKTACQSISCLRFGVGGDYAKIHLQRVGS